MTDDVTRRRFLEATSALVLLSKVADAATAFTNAERRTLAAAMDAIVPADGRMPAASAARCAEYIAETAQRDADLRARLGRLVASLGPSFADAGAEGRVAALRDLERTDAGGFATLRDLVYEAYYTSPQILRLLGHPAHPGAPQPPGALAAAAEPFDERMLQRVRGLPTLYREVP